MDNIIILDTFIPKLSLKAPTKQHTNAINTWFYHFAWALIGRTTDKVSQTVRLDLYRWRSSCHLHFSNNCSYGLCLIYSNFVFPACLRFPHLQSKNHESYQKSGYGQAAGLKGSVHVFLAVTCCSYFWNDGELHILSLISFDNQRKSFLFSLHLSHLTWQFLVATKLYPYELVHIFDHAFLSPFQNDLFPLALDDIFTWFK